MKICIDAGHNYSGYDTGAQGNGLKEQDITFQIADKLKVLLAKKGITVIMTRNKLEENSDNSSINASIAGRARLCNDNKCDCFISIHCNAGGGIGTESYAYSKQSKGYELAVSVNSALVRLLPLKDRGVKTANFGVLRLTNCPAILVETAFIDNYADSLMLKNNQADFAAGIANGVFNYFGIKSDKEVTISDMKSVISEKCGFSSPDDVFRLVDSHPYAKDLYQKWYKSYGY